MRCIICDNQTKNIFEHRILGKYLAQYNQCNFCGFMQIENPFWLKEAYETAITNLDIGLLMRADICVEKTINLIDKLTNEKVLNENIEILDFAAGYGVFVRKMRDNGVSAFWQDDYCENIFAKNFEYTKKKYDLVTAFEVFEHVENPKELINRLSEFSDIIYFSTELVPAQDSIEDWWYLTPSTGQHISFYTKECLEILASINNFIYINNGNFHLFINKNIDVKNPFIKTKVPGFIKYLGKVVQKLRLPVRMEYPKTAKINRPSLLFSDFQMLKNKK